MKKCLIIINLKHSISATIDINVIDTIYVGELEIHRVLTYHCATYSVWPSPLLIVLYLVLTAKTLDTSDLHSFESNRGTDFFVVVVYFILSRLLNLAFSANLGLLCMPHPGMGPLV